MELRTERLILRPWREEDAESLYVYAKDPDIGPPAGWLPHGSVEESRKIIETVLSESECYALCKKEDNIAIGSVGLSFAGHANLPVGEDECELGYWLGKPFWGNGFVPEAAEALLHRGFEELNRNVIWCGYFEGNWKSARVQEKLGFVYHHTCKDAPVPLLGETRTEHINCLTKAQWLKGQTGENR